MDYSLKYLQYIPAAMFKIYCANMRSKQRVEYPNLFRKLHHQSIANREIADQLLDLKNKTLKARSKLAKTDEDDERYKIPQL